jgi:O-acetylserine/cysteine efflux transporter
MRAGILRRGGDLGPGACAAEGARVARGIECGDLSPMREMRRCHERIHRLLRRTAGAQQCRAAWSKPRIGAMLGAHGSYSGLAPRDTRSTAIADVATAAPIRPVRGQRPMSEKVLDFMLRSADVREPGETASLDGGNIIPATGFIQLAVSVVLLSSAWPLTKIALNLGSTPLWFAEGRAVLSGLTAALILAIRGRLRLPHRVDLPALIAVGVFQLGGYFALAHEAVAWIPAGRTAILANTTTMWVVPLSLIFLHERIPLRRWLAVVFGVVGVVVLMSPWAIDWTSANVVIGHTFLLGASFSWSIAIIVTRVARPRMSMFELLPWCFAVSAVMLLPLLLWRAPHGGIGTGPVSWAALGYIGLIAGPIGTWCVMQATAMLPTVVSSVGFLATPAISLLLANVFLGERFTVDLLVGSALIVGGVGFAAWPGGRR